MQKFCLPMVAAISLLAVPAFAQGDSSKNSSSQSPESMQQIAQDLKQDLSKAGYTDIQVAPGSFLVHAKDKKGQPTEMMVTPNSLTAITEVNASSGSSSGGASSSKSSK